MADSSISSQEIYTIYGGDIQIRTPQDQGPMQNAAVDKGAVPVALRTNYTDATSPSYFVGVVADAYQKIIQPELQQNSQASFSGLTGMGDYGDMGCDQEESRFEEAASQLFVIDPALRFNLLVPGNHGRGQYMGTINSSRNFTGLGLLWPGAVDEVKYGACGDYDSVQEAHEDVRAHYNLIEKYQSLATAEQQKNYKDILVEVHRGTKNKIVKMNGDIVKFKNNKEAFETLWQELPGVGRYSARIHYDSTPFDFHDDETRNPDEQTKIKKEHAESRRQEHKLVDFSHEPGDVHQWIDLQAVQVADFKTTQEGVSVPVYEIALDTLDYTAYAENQAAIFGHITEFQISAVIAFMDHMRELNHNAKFKLTMHYPINDLVCRAETAFRRLLNRDDVILVTDAHVHRRGYESDMTKKYHLHRSTPLPHLTISSSTDEPREVVVEKMSYREENSGENKNENRTSVIDFDFTYHGLTEEDIAPKDLYPQVYQAADELEKIITEKKLKLYDDLSEQGISTKKLIGENGNPKWIYLNNEEIVSQIKNPLMKIVATGTSNRDMQIWTAVKMFLSLKGRLANSLTSNVSIPTMKIDFEMTLPYFQLIADLLAEEGMETRSADIQLRIDHMNTTYQEWLSRYKRRAGQHVSIDEMRLFNDLYTASNMEGMYDYIQSLPDDLMAKRFAVLIGKRASVEEARYSNNNDIAAKGVATSIQVSTAAFAIN